MRYVVVWAMLAAFVVGCESDVKDETQKFEQNFTEAQQERLITAVPPPELKDSLERANLKKRLERFNDPAKVSYIYLLARTGQVVAFYPVKGKVSSVNSKLTTGEQVVQRYVVRQGYEAHVVESPQLDGSYGSNGDAVFFFTTEDIYVEWNGSYMLCDRPLKLSTPPLIVYSRAG